MFKALRLAAILLLAGPATAFAHVTLETAEAPVGAGYKAVLRLPHGCTGTATVGLSVAIPEGLVAVKPMPKPGWTVATVKGRYQVPHSFHGKENSEGVVTVSWSGGRLPDDFYDEFGFTGFLATDLTPGTTLYFPVTQTCESGVVRWVEIPAAGQDEDDLKTPAPGLKLLPATGSHHH